MAGTSARNIIAPVNGYRGTLAASGRQVKDHAKENRLKIRELARKKAEDGNNSSGGMENFRKMKQFQGVKSRVFEERDDNRGDRGEDMLPSQGELFVPAKQTNFLKKKSGDYRESEDAARANLQRLKMGEEVSLSDLKRAHDTSSFFPDFSLSMDTLVKRYRLLLGLRELTAFLNHITVHHRISAQEILSPRVQEIRQEPKIKKNLPNFRAGEHGAIKRERKDYLKMNKQQQMDSKPPGE